MTCPLRRLLDFPDCNRGRERKQPTLPNRSKQEVDPLCETAEVRGRNPRDPAIPSDALHVYQFVGGSDVHQGEAGECRKWSRRVRIELEIGAEGERG